MRFLLGKASNTSMIWYLWYFSIYKYNDHINLWQERNSMCDQNTSLNKHMIKSKWNQWRKCLCGLKKHIFTNKHRYNYLTFLRRHPPGPRTLSKRFFPTWASTALSGSSNKYTWNIESTILVAVAVQATKLCGKLL